MCLGSLPCDCTNCDVCLLVWCMVLSMAKVLSGLPFALCMCLVAEQWHCSASDHSNEDLKLVSCTTIRVLAASHSRHASVKVLLRAF